MPPTAIGARRVVASAAVRTTGAGDGVIGVAAIWIAPALAMAGVAGTISCAVRTAPSPPGSVRP